MGKSVIVCCTVFVAAAACAVAQTPTEVPAKKIGDDEEKNLQSAKVATDNSSLLAYLKARTLKDEDRERIEKLIAELDNGKYAVREQASRELKQLARAALPL